MGSSSPKRSENEKCLSCHHLVYIHIDHPTNQPLRLVLYFQGLVDWDLMFDDLEDYDEGLLFCSSVCLGAGPGMSFFR